MSIKTHISCDFAVAYLPFFSMARSCFGCLINHKTNTAANGHCSISRPRPSFIPFFLLPPIAVTMVFALIIMIEEGVCVYFIATSVCMHGTELAAKLSLSLSYFPFGSKTLLCYMLVMLCIRIRNALFAARQTAVYAAVVLVINSSSIIWLNYYVL